MQQTITRDRSGLLSVVCCAAWAVFGAGLLGPLTPSEGHPFLRDLVLFAVLPVCALAVVVMAASSRVGRFIGAGQALAMLGILTALVGVWFR